MAPQIKGRGAGGLTAHAAPAAVGHCDSRATPPRLRIFAYQIRKISSRSTRKALKYRCSPPRHDRFLIDTALQTIAPYTNKSLT
jgi:hypothetical protein